MAAVRRCADGEETCANLDDGRVHGSRAKGERDHIKCGTHTHKFNPLHVVSFYARVPDKLLQTAIVLQVLVGIRSRLRRHGLCIDPYTPLRRQACPSASPARSKEATSAAVSRSDGVPAAVVTPPQKPCIS
eukprot:3542233-Prymnesium_polylepis.1